MIELFFIGAVLIGLLFCFFMCVRVLDDDTSREIREFLKSQKRID